MPVTTVSAAAYITPVVIKTFFEHGKRKAKKYKEGDRREDAKDDIFFDQAFNIVKAFIDMGTKNTVESLQAFTNTHVPAPFWAAVAAVLIPLSSCNRAADILIDWFGPEELKQVVGGERWWQVRGLDGIEAEWVTQGEYLRPAKDHPNMKRKLSNEETTVLRMDHLETVMLYVHGGGYFWGSINTHRYQIIRYARKIKGRVFAVNYRKAPQYPWPCPLQDVLAAYLYLTQPPPEAQHTAVSPSKIVLAGDSAGGGLCITVLTILRDLGLPLPAGAVLISPWVDLTHSFPSVMENRDKDIIPIHGFLAKPSTLWPMDPLKGEARVVASKYNPPPEPGHADTLKPSKDRFSEAESRDDVSAAVEIIQTQAEMLHEGAKADTTRIQDNTEISRPPSSQKTAEEDKDDYDIDLWEPKPPKVMMGDPDAVPLELRSQIQLYAATEQLSHPLVSPILQGSLGNLPPLYIIAGNDELLRDETLVLAHRAAHPAKYPTRRGVLRDGHRQKENAERFTTPTKVHLQVFDGMCHVLTVFSFTPSAKCAYRSIAEFVKHVSNHDAEHLERNPFPEFHRPPLEIPIESSDDDEPFSVCSPNLKKLGRGHEKTKTNVSEDDDVKLYKRNEANAAQEVKRDEVDMISESERINGSDTSNTLDGGNDVRNVLMVRERVDIRGISRPMEPPDEITALKIPPEQIGIIKEAPTRRWFDGQMEWDRHYTRAGTKVLKSRVRLEAKAAKMLENACRQGLILKREAPPEGLQRTMSVGDRNKIERIQDERRWGPLDLDDEIPPPTAIAKRQDTPEAIALLKKTIYHTAPITHRTVPKMRMSDAVRAAFDPNDDPNKPPRQSVSEQQVRTHVIPVHGLRMWDGIVRYFGKETSKKARKSTQHVGEQLGIRNRNK
ncbi:alpha/beta-hydrolase [Lyophyllum atratum]|nr:alpha/beta-hydrolase [Lyophyllum atratum]